MGCDIHMWAEIRKRDNWNAVGRVFDNTDYDPKSDTTLDDDGYEWNRQKTEHPYDDRDYEMFSILADVRNDDRILSISVPRGLPDDVSDYVKAQMDSWGTDGHSHSWVTLQELKEFNLDQEFYDTRLVLARNADGRITETCRATTGEHLGEVGKRKLFGTWGTKGWDRLIANLESVKRGRPDSDVRIVFCFDN